MKIWRVIFKRFSEIEKNFIWVEDFIEADRHRSTACGVLEFVSDSNRQPNDIVQSIPPGCWMGVEEKK